MYHNISGMPRPEVVVVVEEGEGGVKPRVHQ